MSDVYDRHMSDVDLETLGSEVAATLEALRASGDLAVGQTAGENDDLAVFLLEAWGGLGESNSGQRPALVVLTKQLRAWANYDPIYDWPVGAYQHVASAVADTIERGFHLDPLPPGATGLLNDGQVDSGLRKQFAQSLFAAAGESGYRAEQVREGSVKSFDEYLLTDSDGARTWVLAHHVYPVFAAVGSVPGYGLIGDFVDHEVCQRDWFGPWVFKTPAQLALPLTTFLRSQLMLEEHKSIERHDCKTVGAAMFNLWH